MKLVCPCVSYNYYSCGLKFNWIATPPVCQHHDNEILQATFTTGSLNVHLKTLKWIPCDGLAVVQLQDFKRLFFSVYLWAISECCKIYRTVRQPQTALIDNTIPRNYMVMVTSAAKHSIRHDLHQGHMWSGGHQQNNYLSLFPLLLSHHISLFYQNTRGLMEYSD